jgi:hypothetical protein
MEKYMQNDQMNVLAGLLNGKMILPNKDQFTGYFGTDVAELTEQMMKAAWHSYVMSKGSISMLHWMKKFGNADVFNTVLKTLSDGGWLSVTSSSVRKWSDAKLNEAKLLEYLTPDELAGVREVKKFDLYLAKVDLNNEGKTDLVRQHGKVKSTGLVREGFAKSSRTQFYYDANKLVEYKGLVIRNTTKGMAKVRAKHDQMKSTSADYDCISVDIVNHIANEAPLMDLGESFIDTRGRAIKGALSNVANPIGYKDFRALLVIPVDKRNLATDKGERAIHLAIAEMNGWKADRGNGSTVTDKVSYGKTCYETKQLPELDDELDDLYEIMWLERLYDELDRYNEVKLMNSLAESMGMVGGHNHYWSTPIELDASASMLSYIGCLTGDQRLLEMTNTIYTDGTLRDPWGMTALSRDKFKSVAMKKGYGSSRSIAELWKADKLTFTQDEVQMMSTELKKGAIGLVDMFKEFIITKVQPTEVMELNVYGERFVVECNRHTTVAESAELYQIYDTATKTYPIITHTVTHQEADLKSFKRWFVTGLVHHLDSRVMDSVIGKVMDVYGWGIDIHDAAIVSPEAADDVRQWYADEIEAIYVNRKSILANYFKSINIGDEAALAWSELMKHVVPVSEYKQNLMTLK